MSPSPQVTIPERVPRSVQVRTGCGTFLLYRSSRTGHAANRPMTSQDLFRTLPWHRPPTVYLIDRDGHLVGRAVGARSWEGPAARDFLVALLADKARP